MANFMALRASSTRRASIPIQGVQKVCLAMHDDYRGVFTEVFREEWNLGVHPVQWNVVRSKANVLRGVHVHKRHMDYLIVAEGKATIGLCDLRRASPTERVACTVEMCGEDLAGLVIPPRVAHGFYFHTPAIHIYAVTHYWDPADELGCHWSDPSLGIDWPVNSPIVSERDKALGSLEALLEML